MSSYNTMNRKSWLLALSL